MNDTRKTILGAIALIVIIAIAAVGYNYVSQNYKPETSSNGQATQSPNNLQKAADITFIDKTGKQVKLSDFFGKPIVVNFWASWCPPCKQELPDFQKVYTEKKNDVTFIMIDLVDGQRETVEKGKAYFSDNNLEMPLYHDVDDQAGTVYGISSIPTTIFIDKNGNIAGGQQGMISEDILRQGIASITK